MGDAIAELRPAPHPVGHYLQGGLIPGQGTQQLLEAGQVVGGKIHHQQVGVFPDQGRIGAVGGSQARPGSLDGLGHGHPGTGALPRRRRCQQEGRMGTDQGPVIVAFPICRGQGDEGQPALGEGGHAIVGQHRHGGAGIHLAGRFRPPGGKAVTTDTGLGIDDLVPLQHHRGAARHR